MKINWSEEPAGTEAAHPESEGFYMAWYRRNAAGLVEQICPAAGINRWTCMGGRRDFPNGHVLRDSSDHAWTSEGLPPIGVAVNVELGNSPCTLRGAIITAIGKRHVLFTFMGSEQCRLLNSVKLRPIRTPEQIAADEREKAIEQMVEDLERFFSNPRVSARTIYDAGYRKQVDP